MQHRQDGTKRVECKVQLLVLLRQATAAAQASNGAAQASLTGKPRSLAMSSPTSANGGRALFVNHLLSTNTFEGVLILWMMMMVEPFFLLIYWRNISLLQSDGEDELKKRQLMELAIINGTYRDSSSKNSSRKSPSNHWCATAFIDFPPSWRVIAETSPQRKEKN